MLRTFIYLLVPVLVITSNLSMYAQEPTLPAPEACCSSIIVQDMEQSKQWYVEAFGFETASQFKNDERGIAITNMKLGTMRLELIEIAKSMNPDSLETKTGRLQGLFKFGIRVREFDAWMDHLTALVPDISKQVVSDPVSKRRMVVIRDPDGNRLQIFEQ